MWKCYVKSWLNIDKSHTTPVVFDDSFVLVNVLEIITYFEFVAKKKVSTAVEIKDEFPTFFCSFFASFYFSLNTSSLFKK